ncbi:MAG: arabinogalactan endo-1,4-beta-galactosidase [Bacteroidales bacterium]|nr:arabinogalactan endo-1,4-beta-galactosidase [Bacteroidales bacterium]
MIKKLTLIAACAAGLMAQAGEPTMAPANGYPDFAMGGDLSWTTRIVDNNIYTYYLENDISSDQITTVPDMVLDHGFDAVRLRVWVNPDANEMIKSKWTFYISGVTGGYDCTGTYGYDGTSDLVALATMFANKGARIMVAFHMSDTFADPARQFKPKAWEDCTTGTQLAERASAYVQDVLQQLYDANVNVAWVQIGNETRTGMMKYSLPDENNSTLSYQCTPNCEISNSNITGTKNFVKVFSACAEAAKSVYPKAKTLIHLDSGNDWSKINWTLSALTAQGFNSDMCDLVGLSLYPCSDQNTSEWQPATDKCLDTIQQTYSTYGFPTIICEIGMNNEWTKALPNGTQAQGIAQCNEDVKAFTQYLIDNLREQDSTCEGFFYWEPETDYLDGYTMGACVAANPGSSWPRDKVTANDYWKTVKENSTFPDGGLVAYENAGISSVTSDDYAPARYYNLQGIEIVNPTRGLYIKRQGNKSEKLIIN